MGDFLNSKIPILYTKIILIIIRKLNEKRIETAREMYCRHNMYLCSFNNTFFLMISSENFPCSLGKGTRRKGMEAGKMRDRPLTPN